MITGWQIRAARAAVKWSVQKLADTSGVSIQTIKRLEVVENVPDSRTSTLLAIKAALESAGIEFIGSSHERAGIRYSPPRPNPA